MSMLNEIVIIILLILLNGFFSLSEMSLISSRKARLKKRADEGSKRHKIALQLSKSPGIFLSTAQIGITLIGTLAGAFGGATVARAIEEKLLLVPALASSAKGIGLAVVVVCTTILSIILGELVPKRIALNYPEQLAGWIVMPMNILSKIFNPVVKFLDTTTNLILKALRIKPSEEPEVTEEEIKILIEQGTQTGLFEETEQDMAERVLFLSDKKAESFMTPRRDIIFIELRSSVQEIKDTVIGHPHCTYFPVCKELPDDVVGVVQAKDILVSLISDRSFELKRLLMEPLYVPESMDALKLLSRLRKNRSQMAIVMDEYGGLKGTVILRDILEGIVGDIVISGKPEEPEYVLRADGSYLIDGMMSFEDFKELTGFPSPRKKTDFNTLAGFIFEQTGHIPTTGELYISGGFTFEVVDMDGNRIDKVLVSKPPKEAEGEE
jgi:putative hemolysin